MTKSIMKILGVYEYDRTVKEGVKLVNRHSILPS